MRKMAISAAAIALAAISLSAAPAAAAPADCNYMGYQSGPDLLGLQFDPQEQKMFDTINAYRKANGLAALKVSESLRRPAMWASLDSVVSFGQAAPRHIDSRGMGIEQRIAYCSDYSGNWTGEINYYYKGGTYNNSVQPAFEWWKQSPGHNALMLSPNYTTMAVGLAYNGVDAEIVYVWTVVFGDR